MSVSKNIDNSLGRNLAIAFHAYRLGVRIATEERRWDADPDMQVDKFWKALEKVVWDYWLNGAEWMERRIMALAHKEGSSI